MEGKGWRSPLGPLRVFAADNSPCCGEMGSRRTAACRGPSRAAARCCPTVTSPPPAPALLPALHQTPTLASPDGERPLPMAHGGDGALLSPSLRPQSVGSSLAPPNCHPGAPHIPPALLTPVGPGQAGVCPGGNGVTSGWEGSPDPHQVLEGLSPALQSRPCLDTRRGELQRGPSLAPNESPANTSPSLLMVPVWLRSPHRARSGEGAVLWQDGAQTPPQTPLPQCRSQMAPGS